MNIKKAALASVILTFSALAMTAPAIAEAGYNCQSPISASSRSVTKGAASWQARMSWRSKVTLKHGPTYAIWRLGEERSSSCKRKWGHYQCRVEAKPCM